MSVEEQDQKDHHGTAWRDRRRSEARSLFFVEDLGADSLDLTELIMAMEEAFDVEIADDDAQKILKVKDAISYVQNHTN